MDFIGISDILRLPQFHSNTTFKTKRQVCFYYIMLFNMAVQHHHIIAWTYKKEPIALIQWNHTFTFNYLIPRP